MKRTLFLVIFPLVLFAQIQVGTFEQETAEFFKANDGLPSAEVTSVEITANGTFYAGTAAGLAVLQENQWKPLPEVRAVVDLAASVDILQVLYKTDGELRLAQFRNDSMLSDVEVNENKFPEARLVNAGLLSTAKGLFSFEPQRFKPRRLLKEPVPVSEAVQWNSAIWLAADDGLFRLNDKELKSVHPSDDSNRWALQNVAGVTIDANGALWFASPQGVGTFDGQSWSLYTGAEGLPYTHFTCAAAGGDGAVWFGTEKGAIRYDGDHWAYRQGLRWLPDDFVNDIALDQNGNAWIATPKGIGLIKREPMTLAEKATWYESEIEKYHRRTPYEYVLGVSLAAPGDKSDVTQHDSDNDGLWTSMYGAGECYAYAATGDSLAKQRALQAFEALKFLGDVTQGTEHSPPPGFVARTILPTDGPDPNDGRIERDRRHKAEEDTLWKIIDPRWPVSEDGKWYWKTDTSSDELDGHYYFYGLYYDLVADTEAEKTRVRQHVRRLTDHLIEHDFQLVDHDGRPTRWARFNPYELNHDRNWAFDRNLNSLSMLAFLLTAAHITDEKKYIHYAEYLVENHGYLQNAQLPKTQRGIGTGNQSDDEMALMMLYNFIKYAPHDNWRERMALACWTYGRLEQPEMNPFFNFVFASSCSGKTFTDAWGEHSLEPTGPWLQDAVETLKRFPLDRVNWSHDNRDRIDIMPFDENARHFDERSFADRGRRVNGNALPVDERHFNHWNHDPYQLKTGGNGMYLSDGAVFLLPYYMGLYYGYIR